MNDLSISAILLAGLVVFAASCALTYLALVILQRCAVLDQPNERSMHQLPTPRGGGIGLLAALLPTWIAIEYANGSLGGNWPILLGAVLLAIISFVDDLKGLSPLMRIAPQAIIVFTLIHLLPLPILFDNFIPHEALRLLLGFAWLWFINLFNFMDGIDAISGVEAASIGIGVALIAGLHDIAGIEALLLAAATLGFLWWNKPPARIFLGDVGSVPLGFLLFYLLLQLIDRGFWPAALILPLYYWFDATITLLRRLQRREAIWRAHKSHFYQRAVQARRNHGTVVRWISLLNLLLIALALTASRHPSLIPQTIFIGFAAVVGMLVWFSRPYILSKSI